MDAEHLLTIKLDDGELSAVITCRARPGAWCRMWCPDGCEEWGSDHDAEREHRLVDYGKCLAVESFDALSAEPIPASNTDELTPGPVAVFWCDGGWEWERTDAQTENTGGRVLDHPMIGKRIICGGQPRRVLAVIDYEPGQHDRSPIWNLQTAREYVTTGGSRWTGVTSSGVENNGPTDVDARA